MGHGGRCRANAHDGVRIQLREKNSKKEDEEEGRNLPRDASSRNERRRKGE